ncbi:hypothetical protein M3P05_13555 [Sansalvadorimonas sp. 2012CJ34-2]|uniref:Uncharacterized protein n=1 Tax=Parendozoicomonas callyspongiae TaxID=2942213 RepID=A0ABT0PI63_9GAMM|nr:hypothetical protein [Sansalvadorimonas sp. 2012CJ34-2]MCL6270951.1 hypothetical protein [Sansalvadorimonas sp. 2012CJ34-2]
MLITRSKRYLYSHLFSCIIALTLCMGSMLSYASNDLHGAATEAEQQINTINTFMEPTLRDISFISRWVKDFSGTNPVTDEVSHARFQRNGEQLRKLMGYNNLLKTTPDQLQKEVSSLVEQFDQASERYFSPVQPVETAGLYLALAAVAYGVWQSIPFHVFRMTAYLGAGAGIYTLARIFNSQLRESDRLLMHNLQQSMAHTTQQLQNQYQRLQTINRETAQGRLMVLQNTGFQCGAFLETANSIHPATYKQFFDLQRFSARNNTIINITKLQERLDETLVDLDDRQMLVLTLADKPDENRPENEYRLIRRESDYYLGLTQLQHQQDRKEDRIDFLKFSNSSQLLEFFQNIAHLSQTRFFGYLTFSLGESS